MTDYPEKNLQRHMIHEKYLTHVWEKCLFITNLNNKRDQVRITHAQVNPLIHTQFSTIETQ